MWKHWNYYRLHLPGFPGCQCKDKGLNTYPETSSEMNELMFYKELDRWNRMGSAHWQYWSA